MINIYNISSLIKNFVLYIFNLTITTIDKIDLTKAQYKDFIEITNLNLFKTLITKSKYFRNLQNIIYS